MNTLAGLRVDSARSKFRGVLCTAAIAFGCAAAGASAQVSFTGGQVGVTFSWSGGDPLPGYEDPDTVWSATASTNYSGDYGHAGAYLAHGNGTIETYLVSGNTAFVQTPSGWGFYDQRVRSMAYESTHVQNMTLSQDCTFTLDVFLYGFTGPFDSATLLNVDVGGAPIDLLTTTSGYLPAGNYQWQTSLIAAWTNDVQYGPPNGVSMTIHFQPVPAPGAAALFAFALVARAGRRR